jgi:pimeloyl-ACP methyl ester carboxylesterase
MTAFPPANLKLAPYRLRDADVEQGTLPVPVHHAAPGGATIELRFVRLKSRAATPGPAIIFLTGGPGLSGIRSGEGRLFPFFDSLRSHADVILLDQRACVVDEMVPRSPAPVFETNRAMTRDDYLRGIRATVGGAVEFLEARGIPIDSLNSNESADDVAMVAHALYGSNARIALLGWSYGSHLAMAIMKRHESMVARAVLVAPEGPDQTLKRPIRIQEHLERLSQRAGIDLTGLLSRALERLEQEPAQVAIRGHCDAVAISRFDLEWILSECLADLRTLEKLPTWLAEMESGDFQVIGYERLLRGAWKALRSELPFSAVRYAFDCASGATAERLALIEKEASATLLGNTIDFPAPDICDAVGCPDLGDSFRAAPRSDAPVLFITGTLDCRTPAENVAELAPGLPNHEHVVIEDAGHGDLLLASAAQSAILRFLSDV